MAWRSAAKIVIAAGEAVVKAFSRAVREELNASKQAAARFTEQSGGTASQTRTASETNARLGISLQESMQILNVKPPLNEKEVEESFQRLFEINDKTKGGSLYLQSKVYRAKERIDEELRKPETERTVPEAEEVKPPSPENKES